MVSNTLIIQLTPSYRATAESMGHDFDTMDIEANNYSILHKQGWDIEHIEIEPGQRFEIPVDVESAIISCENVKYKVFYKDYEGKEEPFFEYEEYIDLEPGKYLFWPDGIKIEKLSSFPGDSDDYEEDR